MLAASPAKRRKRLTLHPRPRIAPPLPARSMIRDLEECAADLELVFMEWQRITGRYMTALGRDDNWLYRRIAAIASRQNGKTEVIKPRVLLGFKLNRKMLHTAQDRSRPRKSTFEPLVDFFANPANRMKYGVRKIREANGQEEIICNEGGSYTIAAPRSGGARGGTFDDIFIDEAREFTDYSVDGIIRPTILARPNAQIMYFSNAGHADSVILNDLRAKRDDDRNLAYLEWSAPSELDRMDPEAWAWGNPAMGTTIDQETLADFAATMQPEIFDTEHLCRWVVSMRERLVRPEEWQAQEFAHTGRPTRPVMGIKTDISGMRTSAVVAWLLRDGRVALEVAANVTGDVANGEPINVTYLAPMLLQKAREYGVGMVYYDPITDGDLARHFRRTQKVYGQDYVRATLGFENRVKTRQFVVDDELGIIAEDLTRTVKHPSLHGSHVAGKAKADEPNSAAEAAILATWFASNPVSIDPARIH